MRTITTNNGTIFEIEYAGPVSITENIVFLAKIINSDVDSVHNAFRNADNASHLILRLSDEDEGEEFFGYARYCGFSVDNDGGITVTLKRNVGQYYD